MRVLVLHSDVAQDAPPQDLETLSTARTIANALAGLGHIAVLAPFVVSADFCCEDAEIVFNMVETVFGQDALSAMVPSLLDQIGMRYTGSGAATLALTSDKPLTKRVLRAAALPTPDWSEPPEWVGLEENTTYIVKSATEDASLALDDGAVANGRSAISRAKACSQRYQGRWFAERFVPGREFNVALIQDGNDWQVLPIPEMRFENWPSDKPRIVGFDAKWKVGSPESDSTVRAFGVERDEPRLASRLRELARRACDLTGVKGYARVDFRVDETGEPTILEINPNPCLAPDSGFAATAFHYGWSFPDLVAWILKAAH